MSPGESRWLQSSIAHFSSSLCLKTKIGGKSVCIDTTAQDFGDSIPGHGGMTDRMDCQMVMAVFAYIYHQSFITPQSVSVKMILDQILMNLSFEEQRALYTKLA